jgi:KaiC/GvpD/RAD55 family RecA-like ATPase
MQSGGKVLWLTTEELPSSVREGMKKFGWDIAEFEKSGSFSFLDAVSPSRLGISENMGHGMLSLDPTGILIALSEKLRSNKETNSGAFIIVIDSISRLLLSCDFKAVIDFVSCLSSRMESYRVVGLATLTEGAHDEKTLNAVSFSCSGTLRFRVVEENESRSRWLRLESMRGTNHDERWKNYSITGNGLTLEL